MTARSKQEDKHFIHTIIIEIGRTQQQCWFFRFFVYGCIKSLLPFLLQQVLQCRVVLDALQFITYNLLDLILDAVVVVADCLLHDVIAVGIGEVGNDGDGLVVFHLGIHLGRIHHNLSMENLLFNTLVEVVGHRADKHSLSKT